MKLFKFEKYELKVEPQIWGLLPFKKLLDRDKTKDKSRAFKEVLFIYYYADVKSNYQIISNLEDRAKEIIYDIKLPKTWKIDNTIEFAIDYYIKMSTTPSEKLYEATLKAANDIADYLQNTDELLAERDERGKPVNDITKITNALTKIPSIMKDLKASYKELIKEKKDTEGRSKGSQDFNTFEDGLNFDE